MSGNIKFHSYDLHVYITGGNEKVQRLGVLWWHNVCTEFNENP
jgi:hypothetical protein